MCSSIYNMASVICGLMAVTQDQLLSMQSTTTRTVATPVYHLTTVHVFNPIWLCHMC